MGAEFKEDYYSYFNLSKEASTDQINASYRNLSRMYHPDKHVDPDAKIKAELIFNRTNHAYEVLSDPKKRAIYDAVGEDGLQAIGWELIYDTKTPLEIREEYERLRLAAEERQLYLCTNPRGSFTVSTNASDIFAPYEETNSPRIEISSMNISQSIEAPITRKDTIIMSGNLMCCNGNGSGNFMLRGRHLLKKGWLELDVGGGNGPQIGIKGGRTISSLLTANGGISLIYRANFLKPVLFSSLSTQIDKNTVGLLILNWNTNYSLTTQLEKKTDQSSWSSSLVIGSPYVYWSIGFSKKILESEMKIKLSAKFGSFGFVAEYGAEKKVSKYSSVSGAVSIGFPSGVTVKLKVVRSNQSYDFPIHLSDEVVPAAVFYASITPILVWVLIKKTVIDPMKDELKKIELEKTRKNHERRVKLKKQEARASVDLMLYTFERIVAEEKNREGLLIKKATYGVFDEGSLSFKVNASIDVTIPLQCLVRNSQLMLYGSSKSELPGFYDPAVGEEKLLRIEFSFGREEKTTVLKDHDYIALPQTITSTTS